MSRKFGTIFLFLLLGLSSSAQLVRLKRMIKIPKIVDETSGLEKADSLGYLIHNDSFKEPNIYLMDQKGQIKHQCKLIGVEAFDLEDICYSNGNIYIADAGNNFNERKNVFVYIISLSDYLSNDSLQPEVITLSYKNQTSYPPIEEKRNFDSESIFKLGNELFIFSKNRGISSHTYAYRFPASPGKYEIEPYDSFDTGGWITAADVHPENKYMVLSSQDYLWLFYDYEGANFFQAEYHFVKLPYSQKESVLIDGENVYMADEKNLFDGFIYSTSIEKIMSRDQIHPLHDFIFSRPCQKWGAKLLYNSRLLSWIM